MPVDGTFVARIGDAMQIQFNDEYGSHSMLAQHHRLIHAACEVLHECAHSDDLRYINARYSDLEQKILSHLEYQEHIVLHRYALSVPQSAAIIQAANNQLRQLLFETGLDTQLHYIRADSLNTLAALLRGQLSHRVRNMFAWAQHRLPDYLQRTFVLHTTRCLDGLTHARRRTFPDHSAVDVG